MDSRVEREVYVEARPDQVWAALTQGENFTRWYAFGGADIDLKPGGRIVLQWDEHGRYLGFVEKVEPGRRFAYRYAVEADTDPAPGNANLVEFTLTPEGDGARLGVVESGFDRLDPPALAHPDESAQSWEAGLAALAALAATL